MWAWLLVLGIWGIITTILGNALDSDTVIIIGFCLIILVAAVAAVYGSIEYLRWMEAWPFIPQ